MTEVKTKTSVAVNADNDAIRKALEKAKNTFTGNVHEIEVDDYVDTKQYDLIKKNALTAYTTGRDSSYRAMALAYMWYELAKDDKKYMAVVFDKMRTNTPLNMYTNTIKCCFNLDRNSQASTISKYARVLGYISEHNSIAINEQTDDDDFAKQTAKIIADGGGLDACAKAYNSGDGSSTTTKASRTRMTTEDVSRAMKSYKDTERKVVGNFDYNEDLEETSGGLVVMIGRVDANSIDVLDIITSNEVIEHVIRKK